MSALMAINISFWMYVGLTDPHNAPITRVMEYINEAILMCAFYHWMAYMIGWTMDPSLVA